MTERSFDDLVAPGGKVDQDALFALYNEASDDDDRQVSVRFVLSRSDPGHPNWIKTFAHDRGFLILRFVGVENHPLPSVR